MVLIHDMHVLWLRCELGGHDLGREGSILLGIGLEPKVADFRVTRIFDPQLRRPPKNQGEQQQNKLKYGARAGAGHSIFF